MTTDPYRPAGQSGSPDSAKEAAGQVADDAKEQGKQVAETAKNELGNVGTTAKDEAKRLFDQTKTEVNEQAGTQQQKVAEGLRSLAAELQEMARNGEHHGPASDLAQQAGSRAEQIAGWLEGREPGDVLQEVRRFAARKPGAFLAIAAGVGLLAGRLTRGLTADQQQSAQPQRSGQYDAGIRSQQSVPPQTHTMPPRAGGVAWQDQALPGPEGGAGVPGQPHSLAEGERPMGAYGGPRSDGPLDPRSYPQDQPGQFPQDPGTPRAADPRSYRQDQPGQHPQDPGPASRGPR